MKVRDVYGEILRTARVKQGKTLQQVADGAFTSKGYLFEIERGQKEPSSECLGSVVSSLGMDIADFFEEVAILVRKRSEE